jgi:hypothetical protein
VLEMLRSDRESLGGDSNRKMDLALEVVCSIENIFLSGKIKFFNPTFDRKICGQREKSKHNILGNMFCPESEPYHL